MVNNVIGMVNYVIAARPSLLNFMIADKKVAAACPGRELHVVCDNCEDHGRAAAGRA